MTIEVNRPIALITGGSRGVGAETARALARRGYDVALTYRNKAARAADVAADLERDGARALAIGADMTRREDNERLLAQVGEWGGRIDALILNASGGLERDLVAADHDYPTRINRDAQLGMLDGALPLMGAGGVIVFVTSHWAHLYGRVSQIPAYEPVAASKHAGEQAILVRQDELAARGIRLVIATGDLIEGTITPKLLERAAPGLAHSRRAGAGTLPSARDMGEAIAAAVADRALPSGHVVVVGGSLDALLE